MAKRKKVATSRGVATTTIAARYKSAVDKASKSPIGADLWKPETPGDAVAGKIISSEWKEGRDGPYCSFMLDTGAEVVLIRPQTVLRQELSGKEVTLGSEVAIVFRGEGQSSGAGRPPKLFAVELISKGKGSLIVTPEQLAATSRKGKARGKAKAKAKRGK